jgi:hypothetical protein
MRHMVVEGAMAELTTGQWTLNVYIPTTIDHDRSHGRALREFNGFGADSLVRTPITSKVTKKATRYLGPCYLADPEAYQVVRHQLTIVHQPCQSLPRVCLMDQSKMV